ncbi:hypothetical protein HCC61_23980 [Streptomyces sp. HNM0575]|uniref:hypothetical protein n=1 Tax=Streptomyces sp. HNM0575 TaxID=2716338 RepID=UPI00145F5568|nr:hypothetical protein [Streptomyces sp. HNM0575]NLU75677.1 hypothetical protein [Streptomyces sp. HNM0575]
MPSSWAPPSGDGPGKTLKDLYNPVRLDVLLRLNTVLAADHTVLAADADAEAGAEAEAEQA